MAAPPILQRPVHAQAGIAGFFGVELRAVYQAVFHSARYRDAVLTGSQRVGGTVFGVKAVHIIHILTGLGVLEQRVVFRPGTMSSRFQPMCGTFQPVSTACQRAYPLRQPYKAGVFAVLIAFFKQQLHAQADAQKRFVLQFPA